MNEPKDMTIGFNKFNTIENQVVERQEWIEARLLLLKKEKELTRLSDQIAAERRLLPKVRVNKEYVFESTNGKVTLGDLFNGNSQLVIYHFMFAPDWEEGCPGCSFMADHIDGPDMHLPHHDVSIVVVSRAPLATILPFQKRMGWNFRWVSSHGSDFNYDYHVSFTEEQIKNGQVYYNYQYEPHDSGTELPGLSVFSMDADGSVFHTYSAYARGSDILLGAHNFLDFTPKGRNEHETMDWMRHHDKYEKTAGKDKSCCH